MKMDEHLRKLLPDVEREWGVRPHCVLAYQGTDEEHWLVYNPTDQGMVALPHYAIDNEGVYSTWATA